MIESISLRSEDEQPLAHFQHGVSAIVVIDDASMPFVRALPSLIPQKFLREIIVVDVGASEELLSCINKVAHEFPVLRVITNKRHLNKYQAQNLAAKRAFGKYLLFIEQDAILPKDTTVKLIVGFANKGDAPVIVGAYNEHRDYQLLDPKEATLAALGCTSTKYHERAEQFSTHVGAVHPGCFMISRSHFWAFDGFDVQLGEIGVKDLCLKMHMNGGGVYLANNCAIKMQQTVTKNTSKGLIRYYKKHFKQSATRRWLLPLTLLLWFKGALFGMKQLFQAKKQVLKKQNSAQQLQELLKAEPKK